MEKHRCGVERVSWVSLNVYCSLSHRALEAYQAREILVKDVERLPWIRHGHEDLSPAKVELVAEGNELPSDNTAECQMRLENVPWRRLRWREPGKPA